MRRLGVGEFERGEWEERSGLRNVKLATMHVKCKYTT